jgi:hypothetical protein
MFGNCEVNEIWKAGIHCQGLVRQLLELTIVVGEGEHAPTAVPYIVDSLEHGLRHRFVSHDEQRLSPSHLT